MTDEAVPKNTEAHFKVDATVAWMFREAVRRKYKEKAHGMMQRETESALLYYKKKVLDDFFESGLEVKKDVVRDRAGSPISPTAGTRRSS